MCANRKAVKPYKGDSRVVLGSFLHVCTYGVLHLCDFAVPCIQVILGSHVKPGFRVLRDAGDDH